jgi:TetR/AcrR family transcriptional regulator, repressor of fatR-cypB operon
MPDPASQPFFIEDGDPPSKREILKAALRLFVRNGLCETTIRAIAVEAGYTNPALFKFFAGKEELALYLFERCYARLSADIAGAILPGRPFRANLRAVITSFAMALDEQPEAFLYVHEELRRFWPSVRPALRRRSIVGLIKALFQQGALEGAVTAEVSGDLLAHAFIGVLAQFGRASYFGEFPGEVQAWVPKLEQMVSRMAKP